MAFDIKLLEIIACPVCKGKLDFNRDDNVLICQADKLVYPISDSIPVLLEEQATPLQQ
ncbi:MAG: Trm112 family protein [Gammaproteobacteria bacterium]|nr:Trm112 family protein [Gammaproteobacteria bacterium]